MSIQLPARAAWLPLLVCAIVRALWLVPSLGVPFQGDEQKYWSLALIWADLGVYTGTWPPLHPAYLAALVELFDPYAEAMSRVGLSLMAVWTCGWLMALACQASGPRAAVLAGWVWALYLPLVPYSHMLLSEGLHIAILTPALTLLVAGARRMAEGDGTPDMGFEAPRLALAGALMGLACLAREAGFLWVIALTLWCALFRRRDRKIDAVSGSVFLLGALVAIAPWSAVATRTQGSFQLLGQNMGLNAYIGWNTSYFNRDLAGLGIGRAPRRVPGAEMRMSLLGIPDDAEAWGYEFIPNLATRNAAHVVKGLTFVSRNPLYFARTRIVRLADFVTPLSYMSRALRMEPGRAAVVGKSKVEPGGYQMPDGLRRPLTILSMASVAALGLSAVYGCLRTALRPGARSLLLSISAASLATSMVLAFSRIRAPWEAVMIVPAAAAWASLAGSSCPREQGAAGSTPSRWMTAAWLAVSGGLLGLWYLSIPGVVATFEATP